MAKLGLPLCHMSQSVILSQIMINTILYVYVCDSIGVILSLLSDSPFPRTPIQVSPSGILSSDHFRLWALCPDTFTLNISNNLHLSYCLSIKSPNDKSPYFYLASCHPSKRSQPIPKALLSPPASLALICWSPLYSWK